MSDNRQHRGLQLAALTTIRRMDGAWIVPSQSGKGRYKVRLGIHASDCHCDCPDHDLRGVKCKHMYAVEYAIEREEHADGSETVTESVTVTKTINRQTYPQNWTAYNQAQTNEKSQFQSLLFDLCSGIASEPQGKGRPRLPLADAIFAATFKVYSTFSGRRFISDLCDAQTKGYLSRVPHFNSIFNYLENPAVTPILAALIQRSSLPMRAIELDFAVDSTGFTTSRFVRWYDHKYNAIRQEHDWVKAHMMCGVTTNIVTAVEIYDRDASDTKILPSLVGTTATNFSMREISADKGYSSINNHNEITRHGATPYIAFKGNATGTDRDASSSWSKMYHFSASSGTSFWPTTTSGATSNRPS
jgi:hypothetical protein